MDKERLIVKIVKTEKGNIDLVNADGNIFKNVPPVAILGVTQNKKLIEIRQQNDASFYVDPELLQATQVLPAAEVPFDSSATTIYELLALLRADFFFEVVGGDQVPWIYRIGDFSAFFQNSSSSIATINTTANQIKAYVQEVKKSVTLKSVQINITGTAVGNMVIGLYKLEDDFSATLIAQSDPSAEFDTNVIGISNVLLESEVKIEAGLYAFAYHSDVSGVSIRSFRSVQPDIGSNGIITTTPLYNALVYNTAYAANMPSSLPNTLGSGDTCMGIFWEISQI